MFFGCGKQCFNIPLYKVVVVDLFIEIWILFYCTESSANAYKYELIVMLIFISRQQGGENKISCRFCNDPDRMIWFHHAPCHFVASLVGMGISELLAIPKLFRIAKN